MHIWHFLSKDRLLQKINYAANCSGELLLHPPEPAKDITKGQIAQYIYCLPSILSGMNFSDQCKIEVVKISLKADARIYNFEGNPSLLNYTDLLGSYDLVDMTVSSPEFSEIRFRQILLLNSQVITKWEHSLESDFSIDYKKEWDRIQRKSFPQTDFFMIDFNPIEILSAARINSSAMGLKQFPEEILKSDEEVVLAGLKRLNALG